MKQLLQRLDDGRTTLVDAPTPMASGIRLVVRTRASLISAGTERMLLEFGKAGWMAKARQQPEKVKQVLEKVRTDGLRPTVDAVRSKLETPIPLGYCAAGVIVEIGPGARGFSVGDRVVTNGPHAEFVTVPHTLAARIPDSVADELAAFTPVAAIALQGVRLAGPTIGETVVVFGLGLIGLLTVQLLRANGCRVIGIDRDPARLELARRFGAATVNGATDEVAESVLARTAQVGADAVLLTLASDSDEPIRQAALMSRKRGRIVLVGVTGLTLAREDFYQKELSFQVSCSYGPGRYDPDYELLGIDYPLPFVRWTEQRNMQAVLQLMSEGLVDPAPLISSRVPLAEVERAYELVQQRESVGVILTYPADAPFERTVEVPPARVPATHSAHPVVGVIGAGNYAARTLLPLLKRLGVPIRAIASRGGVDAAIVGRASGAARVTSDPDAVLDDPAIDTVFVLTRHDSHAAYAQRALANGKHVFVEKPLALRKEDVDTLERLAGESPGMLTAGFNRRFAPLTIDALAQLRHRRGPLAFSAIVNAGAIPVTHWTRDREVGGGRLVGEGVHFLDLARCLVGVPAVGVTPLAARGADGRPLDDVATLSVSYADGSVATIQYLANGSRSFPKERIDLFFDGRTLTIDNWRRLERYDRLLPHLTPAGQDKGHAAMLERWLGAIRAGGPPPIPYEELFETSRLILDAGSAAGA